MKKLLILIVFMLFIAFTSKSFSQGYDFDLNDLEGNSVKLSSFSKRTCVRPVLGNVVRSVQRGNEGIERALGQV